MSRAIPNHLYPVAAVQDRYLGVYSGGRWLAVANADEPHEGQPRVSWVLTHGPGSDDLDASGFWNDPPDWIAVGDEPGEAVERLKASFADACSSGPPRSS